MSTLLVTGARGFIGRQVLALLEEQGARRVHAVSRGASSGMDGAGGEVSWHRADLLDRSATTALLREVRPTHLLHLAWTSEHGRFWSSPDNLDWVAATLHLARAFADVGGQRFVGAGTCAEYAWNGERCRELETLREPATLYGASKNAARSVLEAFTREAGLSFAWGRLFLMYGPHEDPRRLVSGVISSLMAGERVACTDGWQLRDFLHTRDVAGALLAVLDNSVEGPVNIGSGKPVTIRHVIEYLAQQLAGMHLVDFGARPRPPRDPDSLVPDVGRLVREVMWEPSLDLGTGLTETIRWWSERE